MSSTVMELGKGRGFFKNLTGLYFSPGPEFTAIVPRAAFLKPLLVVIALNVLFTGFWFAKVDTEGFFKAQNERMPRWNEMSAEQRAGTVAMQTKIFKPVGIASAVLGAPILILIVGGFYLFVFRFFLASEVTFKQSLAIVTWSFCAVAIVSVPLTLLVMVLKGDWTIDPRYALQASLAIALDPDTAPKPLYAFARSMDLFVFWILFLLWMGYRTASSARPGVVAAAVLIPWLLWITGQAALSLVF